MRYCRSLGSLCLAACVLVFARAEKSADAAVIATVKTGEPFTFECENDAE